MYVRDELKKIVAKLLDIDETDISQDVFICVNFIKAIYVLFGHPEKITEDEYRIMQEAYNDLENNRCLKE